MKNLLKVAIAASLLPLSMTAACEPKSDVGSKPCLVDDKVAHSGVNVVELIWDAAVRPFVATGYAKDTHDPTGAATININEIVTESGPFRMTLAYSSGCEVLIMIRVSNEGKAGMAYVKIADGDNKCEWHEEYVLSQRCDLYTNR